MKINRKINIAAFCVLYFIHYKNIFIGSYIKEERRLSKFIRFSFLSKETLFLQLLYTK
jgi:hypothetical protein